MKWLLIVFFPATEKISENMHILANEPSLAYYRIQEHVRKTIPLIVERRADVIALKEQLKGNFTSLLHRILNIYFEFLFQELVTISSTMYQQ